MTKNIHLIEFTDNIIENTEVLETVIRLCSLHVKLEKVWYGSKEDCTAAVRLVVQCADLLWVREKTIGHVNGENILQ